jgi:hypothetical protein
LTGKGYHQFTVLRIYFPTGKILNWGNIGLNELKSPVNSCNLIHRFGFLPVGRNEIFIPQGLPFDVPGMVRLWMIKGAP